MFPGMGHLLPQWVFQQPDCRNFFLTSSLNLHSVSLKPLPFVLLQQPLLKNFSPSFLKAPFKYCKAAMRHPCSLLFSRLNNPSSQPFLIAEVFQPSDPFCGPSLDLLAMLLLVQPRIQLTFWAPAYIGGSCPAFHSPVPASPS